MKDTIKLIIALVIGAILVRFLWPKVKVTEREIPVIVTKYDTIKTVWRDTIIRVTTDTFNLIIHQTIHDTVVINVNDNRPNLWPVISYAQLHRDTASIRAFSLISGRGSVSKIYTPGPLIGLYADSAPTPKLNFGHWPERATPLKEKLKYGAIGALVALSIKSLFN